MLTLPPIVKHAPAAGRVPNLDDYERVRRSFTWAGARALLDGLPAEAGLNIAHEASDRHAAGRGWLNLPKRQTRDIDQPGGRRYVILDQVDQIGAAGDELRGRVRGYLLDRVGDVGCAGILKRCHDRSIACWIAARMFG